MGLRPHGVEQDACHEPLATVTEVTEGDCSEMLDGADLPIMPSQRTGYFSRLPLAPLLASQGLGKARQSQHHWVSPSTAVG